MYYLSKLKCVSSYNMSVTIKYYSIICLKPMRESFSQRLLAME